MIARKLRAFERNNDYDGSYVHELLALDLGAFLKFEAATKLGSFRKDVPRDVYFGATQTRTRRENLARILLSQSRIETGSANLTVGISK